MAHDARQIANWFVTRAKCDGKNLSIMSLLKLTYIAHGWHLEMRDRPLFSNKIQAWQYGPVIPEVYNAFRAQGVQAKAPVSVPPNLDEIDADSSGLLEQIYQNYGSLDAFQLSDLTHVPGGPWDVASKQHGYYAPIHDEEIREHYVQKRARANDEPMT